MTVTVRIRESARVLFGRPQPDAVDQQIQKLGRQGTGAAHVAHFFSGLLLILFSVASLIALGKSPWDQVTASIHAGGLAGINIPAAVNLAIVGLIVPCFDVGALIAADRIRLLASRRVKDAESRQHWAVILGVTIIEGGTYVYMAYLYENLGTPTLQPFELAVWIAWTLVVLRAFTAPALAIYLAMARPMPVTHQDILHETELEAGKGVLRDVRDIASDPSAPLNRKVAIYQASAEMNEADTKRFDRLMAAVSDVTPQLPAPTPTPPEPPTRPHGWEDDLYEDDGEEATGYETLPVIPAIPSNGRNGHHRRNGTSASTSASHSGSGVFTLDAPLDASLQGARGQNLRLLSPSDRKSIRTQVKMHSNLLWGVHLLDSDVFMSRRKLQRLLGISQAKTNEIYTTWFYELGGSQKIEEAKAALDDAPSVPGRMRKGLPGESLLGSSRENAVISLA